MIGKVQFRVGEGSYELEIDEKDEMDTLHKMAVLANPPGLAEAKWQVPQIVSGHRFSLDSNKDKEGNTYVNIVCRGQDSNGQWQTAKAKLGQYKAGGYFWHKFDVWQGKANTQSDSQTSDDIPF